MPALAEEPDVAIVTVTDILKDAQGRLLAGALVEATLNGVVFLGGLVTQNKVSTVSSNVGGFTLYLAATGEDASYTITISHPWIRRMQLERVSVPDVTATTLSELMGGPASGFVVPNGAIVLSRGYLATSRGPILFY